MNRIEAFDARGLGVKLLLATPNKSSKKLEWNRRAGGDIGPT
jgi:hypothetical protein